MADYNDILRRAIQVRDAVLEGSNTASLVGGVMVDSLYLTKGLVSDINNIINSLKKFESSAGGGSIDEDQLIAFLINKGYAKKSDIPTSWWGQKKNDRNVVVGGLTDVVSILFNGETDIIDGIANDKTPKDSNSKIVTPKYINNQFVSKITDDTAKGTVTWEKVQKFLQGIIIGNNNAYSIDANGNVTINLINSADYDDATQSGFGFYRRKDGKIGLNVTDISVWGKAYFNNLTIRELTYVGGNLVFSPSAGKIFEVREITDAQGEVTGWKCYLLADDGTTATTNMWEKYDQVKCETFNIQPGVYEHVSNKYYWRLVTDVSTENEVITDAEGNVLYDGKKYAWIIISATDKDIGSDNPAAGDTIVLEGNRTNTDRMSFVVKETYGDNAPREIGYTNVHSYTLSNDNLVYEIGPKKVRFYSRYFEVVATDGSPIKTVNNRGNWQSGNTYMYYDQVTHNGTLWLCIAPEGEEVTEEPSENSQKWIAQTAIVKPKLVLYHDLSAGISLGETHKVTCRGFLGDKDITASLTQWRVTRSTGDSLEDKAWLARDKVRNFMGVIDLTWVLDVSVSDMGNGNTAKFEFSAKMASGEILSESLGINV